ncbi:type II pantothenate kinase [Metasolibacillus meyeri]|uniref:Type II pantothenate kinase n=1 Tax=Metasolibacillus meyeri TaxID=1071052 RepID=A0AAW9NJ93_9BACL|nr:type II pantothenate kinase [Metasolibacillus meyeri]MEC1177495.1 type II pantothenate kinase [Metasolibacillus meyeri]
MVKSVGIDAGGTLTKIAYMNEQDQLILESFPSNDLQLVKEWLKQHPNVEEIGLTGGRTEQLREQLETMKAIEYIVEFEATLKGVQYLLMRKGHQIDDAIITNIGTGTSIHYMKNDHHLRVGGTGIGGGTLVGLAALLTGQSDFNEIKKLASKGVRENIDLLVRDIYQGMDTPIAGDLTASNFGKVGITAAMEHPQEDVLATVQGLVGEVITTLSIQFAEQKETAHIVYIGSTLADNADLQKVIANYTTLKKHEPIFIQDRGFAGAVGALLNVGRK